MREKLGALVREWEAEELKAEEEWKRAQTFVQLERYRQRFKLCGEHARQLEAVLKEEEDGLG